MKASLDVTLMSAVVAFIVISGSKCTDVPVQQYRFKQFCVCLFIALNRWEQLLARSVAW